MRAVFDTIGERLADGRRYLCGDRFTAADLTFAALAAAVLVPPEYGTPLPQPDVLPEPVASEVLAFREHPAGEFALRMFRTERRLEGEADARRHEADAAAAGPRVDPVRRHSTSVSPAVASVSM